ncbi:FeoB-associated Cys-rich membrane protein [Staphylococcus sp. ACRSN]|uniref:FeoB-associated Cys-rich membrane protein n=1 Tax=Staphylococcus sp. ACRSN TaxID=2918214 RepID=UPI001EF19895|nr:FeoB-associated Cys-rich membrane protein [Staphylococcus sp. ACRSN]MCG7337841.1 FeoB-associated Cys-rich membrane protein [Staphylococcus sp. ACRSN]
MTIVINLVLFLAIFGYATYTLIKFIKKSKVGKCSSCGSNQKCSTPIQKSHIFTSNDQHSN